MALRSFYNQIKGKKVSEIPELVKPMLSLDYIKTAAQKGFINYREKYIETDSIQPLYHVCFGGMALFYLIALPEERRRHFKHAADHGAH